MPQNQNPLLAPSKTIHVGNLNAMVTPEVLRQIFGCIGPVVDVRVAGDGRYGFVDFCDSEAASASVAMNGTQVCGTSIRVEKAMQPRLFAQSNQPTPLPPQGAANPAAARFRVGNTGCVLTLVSRERLESGDLSRESARGDQNSQESVPTQSFWDGELVSRRVLERWTRAR